MKITQNFFNKIPNRNFADNKGFGRVINWFDKNVSSPENRLILGATALMSQPFIDLYNRKVDEKTRNVSCARTIAKIIAGTLTGVSVRYACIAAIKNLSAVGKIGSKSTINVGRAGLKKAKDIVITTTRQLFTPSAAKTHSSHEYEQYQNTIGTGLAIIVMVFTNFLIDAPLTKFLTNKLNKKFTQAQEPQGKKEVSNDKR